ESSSDVNVFFDDLKVTQVETPVRSHTDYYPFGLTIAGLSGESAGTNPNKYLYNGMEGEDLSQLYETPFRNYDPQLGRFHQTDPMADFIPGINPYNFAFNNPATYNDPDGLYPSKVKQFILKVRTTVERAFGGSGTVKYNDNGRTAQWNKGFGRDKIPGNPSPNPKPNSTPSNDPNNPVAKDLGISTKINLGGSPALDLGRPTIDNLPSPPTFIPPSTKGVTMVDTDPEDRRFMYEIPPYGGPKESRIASGKDVLSQIADYLMVVNGSSVTITGVNTRLPSEIQFTGSYKGHSLGGWEAQDASTTTSVLKNRANLIRKALMNLGAPPGSIYIAPSYRFNAGNSSINLKIK
ncbi:MAG TPA: RHS repeat-associated core domain-containing protein, partial [Cytophagales bacterium]|nr:RHS repeat-associated core domain-containing protein [Cytophagales bacterium]